jgi:hypothetical protein
MSIQFPLSGRLLRAAVSLGFLGCLIAAETISNQGATSESAVVTSKGGIGASAAMPSFCANPDSGSDLMLSVPVDVGLSDEFGVALEDDDSIEMLRIDIQQRTFGIDQVGVGPRVACKAAQSPRTNISPPLLV